MKLFLKTIVLTAVMALFAACGSNSSFEWFPEANIAPIANAGSNQSVVVGDVVTLDGSASSDENGDALNYIWALTTKPSGSTASLSSVSVVNPTFIADVAGEYILSLTVNDGEASSSAATVTVTVAVATSNTAPVANAGTDQIVTVGSVVTLDGSGTDADGDTLSYIWALTSSPDGSTATLSSTIAAKPTFTADKAGDYIFGLIVNDGTVSSSADSVTITATTTAVNVAPVANAGSDQTVTVDAIVQLDGSGSTDANGDALTYSWRRTSASCGTLSSSTVVNPTLTGSTEGTCIIELQVFDHTTGSEIDTVVVTVSQDTGFITVTW